MDDPLDSREYETALDFRTDMGGQVWENVHDATEYLACADYRVDMLPVGPARHRLENELTAFLILATFRHTYEGPQDVWGYPNDAKYYLEDVTDRRARNPHCLKLYQTRRPRALRFRPELRERPLSVGLLDGYSCIEPVEREMFDTMVKHDAAEYRFENSSMEPGDPEEPPTPHPFLYIQAVTHLPSLGRVRAEREAGTTRVMKGLFRHIAAFLPSFGYDEREDRFYAGPGGELPRLLCSRDGRLMADRMIQGLGFSPTYTQDEVGDAKFLLDFRAYNARAVDRETASRMLRAYRYLKPYLGG